MGQKTQIVISDVDNTLYDWFEIWYRPFRAMLDVLVDETGIPEETLIADIKRVHERHGTSEYAFLIEEIDALRQLNPKEDLTKVHGNAIDAYRETRRSVLKLYPTVEETLNAIRDRSCVLVAYTESMAFYTRYRLRRLGLDHLFDYLYSPRDHRLPEGSTPESVRTLSDESYELERTQQRYTPEGELKPNPQVLLSILSDLGYERCHAVYIGDDLVKDVRMAKDAGVPDVWAKYGVSHERKEYELLKKVTHWSGAAVEVQKNTTEKHVEPTHVAEARFAQLLEFIEL